jgi:hypothetical protein
LADVQIVFGGKKPSGLSAERGGELADLVETSKDGIPHTHAPRFATQFRHLNHNTGSANNKDGSNYSDEVAEYPQTEAVDTIHTPPALHSSEHPTSSTGDSLSIDPIDTSQLPPFDIEKHGDPMISWCLYYDFVVTKAEAYYKLQPGYLATENFPIRKDNKEIHP